jgi:hypothetical protein
LSSENKPRPIFFTAGESQGKEPIVKRSPAFVSRYVNHSAVSSNPFDVRVILSELVVDEAGQAMLEQQVSIVMSPQHAKALLVLLESNINRWQSRFGTINLDSFAGEAARNTEPVAHDKTDEDREK